MDVQTYVNRSQELMLNKRAAEALNYNLNSAREVSYVQFKVLCVHAVAETLYRLAGEGAALRKCCTVMLDWLDGHESAITELPSLREVMEDMYVSGCQMLSEAALSYEEYFAAMERMNKVRPHTELQKNKCG